MARHLLACQFPMKKWPFKLVLAALALLHGPVNAWADPPPTLLARIKTGVATLEQVLPWLDTDQPDLQRLLFEAAQRQPGWAKQSEQLLRQWLAKPEFSDERERQLTGILQTFAAHEEIQQLVAATLAAPSTDRSLRLQLLQCLARARVDPLPTVWLAPIRELLGSKDRLAVQEAVCTIKAKEMAQFDEVLRQLGQNASLPPAIRVAALECLAPRERRCEAAAFRLLREQLIEGRDPVVAVAAARALGGSRLSDAQLLELIEDFPKVPAPAISLLLPALTRSKNTQVGMALVAALDRLPAGSWNLGELDRVLATYPAEVHVRYRPLRLAALPRNQEEWARLARLSRQLPPGDPQHGKQVFLSAKARCSDCHRAAGVGGAVGPNLSRIGVIRSHGELLESIAFPDAAIAADFRTYLATTRTGQVVTGQWLQETTAAIHLRPAPDRRARVVRQEIEELAPARASLMPRGFDQLLTLQELSDLIEFLVSQR